MGEHFGESGMLKGLSGTIITDRGLSGISKKSSWGEQDMRSNVGSAGSLGLSGMENKFNPGEPEGLLEVVGRS